MEAFLVQDEGKLLVGLLQRQLAHFVYKCFGVALTVSRFKWQLDGKVFGGASLPAQMQDRLMRGWTLFQRDVLEQQPQNALAVLGRRGCRLPEPRQVVGQQPDLALLLR